MTNSIIRIIINSHKRRYMKKILIILSVLFFVGCKSDVQLSMERGIQFYEWNLFDKAILEYEKILVLNPKHSNTIFNLRWSFWVKSQISIDFTYFFKKIKKYLNHNFIINFYITLTQLNL